MLKLNSFLLLCTFNVLFVYSASGQQQPVVDAPVGKIRGSILISRLGLEIHSFRSIRYAKAPVGELRFQPPVPVEKWSDVYDATEAGPVCPQPNNTNSSEDCLMLNVYVNKLPTQDLQNIQEVKRPVFVFFHPGGFYSLTGASYLFGPEYLLDQHIVLVTANYRLGSLGFLSTGTKEAPGNNGFKDQVEVLKWVRDNIRAFGGDPDMVTLGGYSAGAVSTNLHMVSPMSRGLFHRSIMMSASAAGAATIPTNQIEYAKKQAQLVNCPDDTPVAIINCLKTKSAQEIADTKPGFAEVGGDPVSIWTAVVEPDFGQERFLTENPVTSMLNGNFVNVPTMMGITQNEFGYVSYIGVMFPEWLELLTNEYLRVLPIIFAYERNTTRSYEISRGLYKFYFGDGQVDSSSREAIDHLYQDGIVGFGVNRALKLISEKNKENTYYYHFTYKGRYSYFYLPNTNNETIGPVHHDDLMYLFTMPNMFPSFRRGDPEWHTVYKMLKMWTDFIKTGNPTPKRAPILNNVQWTPYKQNNPNYLEIGDEMIMKKNLNEDRYKEWEKLFPLSNYL